MRNDHGIRPSQRLQFVRRASQKFCFEIAFTRFVSYFELVQGVGTLDTHHFVKLQGVLGAKQAGQHYCYDNIPEGDLMSDWC